MAEHLPAVPAKLHPPAANIILLLLLSWEGVRVAPRDTFPRVWGYDSVEGRSLFFLLFSRGSSMGAFPWSMSHPLSLSKSGHKRRCSCAAFLGVIHFGLSFCT